jgi:glycosidase
LVRGKIDWLDVSEKINNPDSLETKVYEGLSTMTNSRNKYKAFGRGTIEWIESNEDALLAYFRVYENEKLLFLQNLSGEEITYKTTEQLPDTDILGNKINLTDNLISIPAYSYFWINVSA